jgi:hypothetical protein
MLQGQRNKKIGIKPQRILWGSIGLVQVGKLICPQEMRGRFSRYIYIILILHLYCFFPSRSMLALGLN